MSQSPGDSLIDRLTEDWRARIRWNEQAYLDVNMYIQWWNVGSLAYAGRDIPPRFDAFIRRGRLGASGKIHERVFFNASFAYDGVGKDSFTVSAGIPNAEDNTTFFPRDIFFTYSFHPLFNISMGYFRPRVGKESIYSSAFSISQEKSWASFQPRIHITGRGIGRETGINFGGLWTRETFSLLYDAGIFDTNHPLIVGDNQKWSPLLSGRIVLMLGDREMTRYGLAYLQSGFGQRKGLSLGVNASHQALTSRFRNNRLYGIDAQLNYGALDLLFEYNWLYRENAINGGFARTQDEMLTLKAAWNFLLENGTIVQAATMLSTELADEFGAPGKNILTGAQTQEVFELGFNWLLNRDRLKLGLHYFLGAKRQFAADPVYSFVNASVQFIM
jgi:hypothetical protein